jgi:hypothetical protein
MPTLEEVKAQVNALPPELRFIFYTKKEIKYLPDIMVEGEYIRALTSGYCGKKTVLGVCTNRRIILIDKGMFFGMSQWQIALDRVQSIDGNYLIAFGSIKIWDGAASTKLEMVMANKVDPFIKEVRAAIDDYRRLAFQEVTQPQPQQVYQAPQQMDIASQIERLAQLKEAGHLTEEEFQAQKTRLLQTG